MTLAPRMKGGFVSAATSTMLAIDKDAKSQSMDTAPIGAASATLIRLVDAVVDPGFCETAIKHVAFC